MALGAILIGCETVAADELLPQGCPGLSGHIRAQNRLHGPIKMRALRQLQIVKTGETVIGANNAITAKIIAQRQGNRPRNSRIIAQHIEALKRNVSGGLIDVSLCQPFW